MAQTCLTTLAMAVPFLPAAAWNVGTRCQGFTVTSVTDLPEVPGRMVRMIYAQNGAELVWLDRADDNKTFAIAFRTIPEDDTGVAHILEHSVLCGSEKYPVKEPFVELLKGSFATYLNAWTASDCTMYPVCSRNEADFLNLMDVYLDAVFHPMSVKSPLPFRQEGWHYEFDGEGALIRNGVVLNEMKGAFANPDRLVYHELNRLLFPDNAYRFVSGGDPAAIPALTFDGYKDFYTRHYHPSNARIFLDGRVDLEAVLARLNGVLAPYGRRAVQTAVPLQKPVQAEKTIAYEIAADDSEKDKTILAEGWVIGTFRERETRLAFDVLSDALAGSNEDPLKKALLRKGLCEDVRLSVGGCEQTTAMLVIKNARDGQQETIRRLVRETVEKLAADGLSHARLHALLDRHEFNAREKDYGGFPRGLAFLGEALDQWLYGGDPAEAFRSDALYASLRAKVAEGWFEAFLKRTLLTNPHHVRVMLVPSKTLAEARQKAEKEELAERAASWSEAEREQVKKEAAELASFQKRADRPEDLAKLPRLALKDIPEKGPVPQYEIQTIGPARVIRARTSAHGIAYAELYFDTADFLAPEAFSDVAVLADLLGELPTETRDVLTLKNDLNASLGRFETDVRVMSEPGVRDRARACLVVRVSALTSKMEEMVRLVPDVLKTTSLTEKNLVGDLVKQRRRAYERATAGISGRLFAARRAAAGLSRRGELEEWSAGLAHIRRLQETDDAFEKTGAAYCARLAELRARVLGCPVTVCVSDNVPTDVVRRLLEPFAGAAQRGRVVTQGFSAFPVRREGFRTAGRVGSAAKGAFLERYTGADLVAARLLSLGYLWQEIRVRGGAYGGNFRVRADGEAGYLSWNDPSPARSLTIYDQTGAALRRVAKEETSLDKYIISAVAGTEPYETPSVETTRAAELVLSGRTPQDLYRRRREMLQTSPADLLRFAETLDRLAESKAICIIGGAAQLEAGTNVVDVVESIMR